MARVERMRVNHHSVLEGQLQDIRRQLETVQGHDPADKAQTSAEAVLVLSRVLLEHCLQHCFQVNPMVQWQQVGGMHLRIDPRHTAVCINAQLEARAWLKAQPVVIVPLHRANPKDGGCDRTKKKEKKKERGKRSCLMMIKQKEEIKRKREE